MKLSMFAFVAYFILLPAAMTGYSQTCPGSPGCLDTSYGSGGSTLVPISTDSAPMNSVMQDDQKVISVTGGFATGNYMIRVNANGSLDTSFGSNGVVQFTWPLTVNGSTYYGMAWCPAIQDVAGTKKIVVAGSGYIQSGRNVLGDKLRVERFNLDGSVDTSFGSQGTVVVNTGSARAVAIQQDGKIVTVGPAGSLVRLNVNGSLDTSFGSGGSVAVGTDSSLAFDTTGHIFVGGLLQIYAKNKKAIQHVLSVLKFNTNGTLDQTFGTGGRATAAFGGGAGSHQVLIDVMGNIVAIGFGNGPVSGGAGDYAIARFLPSGQPDLSFNGTGKEAFDFAGGVDDARGAVLQSDGKLVLAGQATLANGATDVGLIRINYDGSLDPSFGSGGFATANVSGADTVRPNPLLQIDSSCSCEKVVVVGGDASITSFARFLTL